MMYKEVRLSKNILEPIQTKSLFNLVPFPQAYQPQIYTVKNGFAYEKISLSQKDVSAAIKSIVQGGSKFTKLNKYVDQQSIKQFMHQKVQKNPHLKLRVYQIMQNYVNQRRIGNNLKGFSKTIILNVQNQIWPFVQKQLQIFKAEKQIEKLTKEVSQSKQNFISKIQKIVQI